MTNIKIVGLGGLDDKGKCCLCINVDNNVIIINCGIEVLSIPKSGIQEVISDYSYLYDKNILGVFITTPYYENYGALTYFLQQIKNVNKSAFKIYSSAFSKVIIDNSITQPVDISIIKSMETLKLGNISITPFKLVNTFPDSLGYAISVGNENIIILDHNVIATNSELFFSSDFLKIVDSVKSKNNILLLASSVNTNNNSFASPQFYGSHFFNNLLEEKEKTFIALYSFEIFKIWNIINYAIKYNRPICFIDKKIESLVLALQNANYIKKNIKIININDSTKLANIIYIFSSEKIDFFPKLTNLIQNEQTIKLTKDDTFVFASSTIPGFEQPEAVMFDCINRLKLKSVLKLDSTIINIQPCLEDIKYMCNLLQPKYIIPFNGLYMHFMQMVNSLRTFIPVERFIVLEDGQIATFANGQYNKEDKEVIKLESQPITTAGTLDSGGANIVYERNQMNDNGVVVTSFLISKNAKKIIKSDIQCFGVFSSNAENTAAINSCLSNIVLEATPQLAILEGPINVISKEFKMFIQKKVSKFFQIKFDKRPLVIASPVFINTINN